MSGQPVHAFITRTVDTAVLVAFTQLHEVGWPVSAVRSRISASFDESYTAHDRFGNVSARILLTRCPDQYASRGKLDGNPRDLGIPVSHRAIVAIRSPAERRVQP
jgi:hypothetical protein